MGYKSLLVIKWGLNLFLERNPLCLKSTFNRKIRFKVNFQIKITRRYCQISTLITSMTDREIYDELIKVRNRKRVRKIKIRWKIYMNLLVKEAK